MLAFDGARQLVAILGMRAACCEQCEHGPGRLQALQRASCCLVLLDEGKQAGAACCGCCWRGDTTPAAGAAVHSPHPSFKRDAAACRPPGGCWLTRGFCCTRCARYAGDHAQPAAGGELLPQGRQVSGTAGTALHWLAWHGIALHLKAWHGIGTAGAGAAAWQGVGWRAWPAGIGFGAWLAGAAALVAPTHHDHPLRRAAPAGAACVQQCQQRNAASRPPQQAQRVPAALRHAVQAYHGGCGDLAGG